MLRDRAVGRVEHRQTSVAHRCARAGGRVEGGDARAARAEALRERALRRQLHLELARQVLPLELLVLADVARDHLGDLLVAEEDPETKVVDPAVVGNDDEALGPDLAERADAALRDAAQAEAAGQDGRPVRDVAYGVDRGSHYLVHPLLLSPRADTLVKTGGSYNAEGAKAGRGYGKHGQQ